MEKTVSSYKKELLAKFAASIATASKNKTIEEIFVIPQEPVNILINVNESFIEDNYDVKAFIMRVENVFEGMLA